MHFEDSLFVSGILAAVFLIIAVVLFSRRLKGISDQLTTPTRKALGFFGLSGLFLALVDIQGLIDSYFVMVWLGLMLMAILLSQFNLIIENEKRVRSASILVIVLQILFTIETLLRYFIVPYPLPPIFLMVTLTTFVVGTVVGSLYLMRESPSPFTVSMFIVIILTLVAGLFAILGFVGHSPEYFMIQVAPVVVAAAVLGSMLRPWRNIISTSLLLFTIAVGLGLTIPAFLEGEVAIWMYTAAATFAVSCLIVPLIFFLEQAVETRASTAMYISLTLIMVGLLVITHASNYAISLSDIGSWDRWILFADWGFGLVGVCAFVLAAVGASFSANIRNATREILIGVGAILLALGHPVVRYVEVAGVEIQRWELDSLYLGLMVLLAIGFIIFMRITYQLAKVGSGGAAARFLFFMFASLGLGIVAMFADMMPLMVLVTLVIMAGVLLLLSSPRSNPFAKG